MFEKSASYYDTIYQHLDYSEACLRLQKTVFRLNPSAKTLLDVACGTGKHINYLRNHYNVEGLDILPSLLSIARERCPDVIFHEGDMVDFELDHKFDVVTCLFCSIGYTKSIGNAEAAVAHMARHLKPGGILIVEPWVTPEACWSNKVTAELTETPDLKVSRMYTHEIRGTVSVFEKNYLVGTPEGVAYFVETEELGLFTHEEYVGAFNKSGLAVSHYDEGLFPGHDYGLYVGIKN